MFITGHRCVLSFQGYSCAVLDFCPVTKLQRRGLRSRVIGLSSPGQSFCSVARVCLCTSGTSVGTHLITLSQLL